MNRLLVVAFVLACGKDSRPSISGDWPKFSMPDAATGVEYVGHLDKLTQDNAGDVAGSFVLGAVGFPQTYAGKLMGVFVDGQPQLQFRVAGFAPWVVEARATEDRMVGRADGSGFQGTPFIAGRGDIAWMALMAKAVTGAHYTAIDHAGGAGASVPPHPLPDITSAFR